VEIIGEIMRTMVKRRIRKRSLFFCHFLHCKSHT